MMTLIAISVLMLLVGGAIQFTNYNREATAEKLRGDRVGACADAARRHLLSRLKLMSSPMLRTFQAELIDDPNKNARSEMRTGHYGEPAPRPEEDNSVAIVDARLMGEGGEQARDIANIAPRDATLGGKYYRVVVKCREKASERESEVEFLFRYGL
jgi:hypothetical protein